MSSLSSALDAFTQSSINQPKESKSFVVVDRQLSTPKFQLTDEQESILASDAKVIKVNAYAGTGKTFILEKFSQRHIKKKGLYIAFNRELKNDAEKRFPSTVKCMTIHGLAFPIFGKDLMHKLNSFIFPQNLAEYIQAPDEEFAQIYYRLVLNTVKAFTYSRDFSFKVEHIDQSEVDDLVKVLIQENDPRVESIMSWSPAKILTDAETVWSHMIDPKSDFPTTHDAYLKLLQLSEPRLPYGTILLDEAQDVNPAMLSIFESQRHCRKVLAGDPYQSIYRFRNSIDAMTYSKAKEDYYLTKSFRFGSGVANVANSFLGVLNENHPVIGFPEIQDKVLSSNLFWAHGYIDGNRKKTKAIISRTNAQLIEESVYAIENGYKIYMEGGEVQFEMLKMLSDMALKDIRPSDLFLASIYDAHKDGKKAFESLIQVSKETDLGDWHVRCKLVKKYQHNIYRVIENITSNICDQRNGEDVMVLTTVHRSKGLEYDLVKLADDFDLRYLLTENNIKKFKERKEAKQKETGHHLEWRQPKRIEDRENLHLLYVGATRAKEVLFLPDELVEHVQNWNVCKGNQPLSHLPSFHKTLDLI